MDELIAHGQVTPARFAAVVGLPLGRPEDALDPYAQCLAAFRAARPRPDAQAVKPREAPRRQAAPFETACAESAAPPGP